MSQPEKFIKLQQEIRQNQEDLQDFLLDLDSWKEDITKKEKKLTSAENDQTETATNKTPPPIRNLYDKKKRRKKKQQTEEKPVRSILKKPNRISGYDYRGWDQFNVEKALEEVDNGQDGHEEDGDESESTDEEWESYRLKQKSLLLKDDGNQRYKEKKYAEAVELYTKAVDCDCSNPLFYSNRAMALLKLERFAAAEEDCSRSISLDSGYVKSFLRRATARMKLGKYELAKADLEEVLKLEPKNSVALAELNSLKALQPLPAGDGKKSTSSDDLMAPSTKAELRAVYKTEKERSRRPLRRVPIVEVGGPTSVGHSRLENNDDSDGEFEKRFGNIRTTELSSDKKELDLVETSTRRLRQTDDENDDNLKGKTFNQRETTVKMETTTENTENNSKSTSTIKTKSSSKTAPVQLPKTAPKTGYSFMTSYRQLKNNSAVFGEYLLTIDPKLLPDLVSNNLDAELMSDVISSLNAAVRNDPSSSADGCVNVLLALSRCQRFNFNLMFLEDDEKELLKEICDCCLTGDCALSGRIDQIKVAFQL